MSVTTLELLAMLAKAGVGVVLVSSGYAKLAGPPAAAERGLPRVLALLDRTASRVLLGAVELGLGAASLLALGSPGVDGLVLVLCAGFFVGSAILGATRPGTACQCFGAASSSAFGTRHTVATGILATSAGLALVGSLGAGEPAWSWHPLMLLTLAGVLVLASRVSSRTETADRSPR